MKKSKKMLNNKQKNKLDCTRHRQSSKQQIHC